MLKHLTHCYSPSSCIICAPRTLPQSFQDLHKLNNRYAAWRDVTLWTMKWFDFEMGGGGGEVGRGGKGCGRRHERHSTTWRFLVFRSFEFYGREKKLNYSLSSLFSTLQVTRKLLFWFLNLLFVQHTFIPATHLLFPPLPLPLPCRSAVLLCLLHHLERRMHESTHWSVTGHCIGSVLCTQTKGNIQKKEEKRREGKDCVMHAVLWTIVWLNAYKLS